MASHDSLRPLFGAVILAATAACAGHENPEEEPNPSLPLSSFVEPGATSLGPELPPPDPIPPSNLEGAPLPRITARTLPHQNSLAVVGQLATAQALIVSLLLVPFSSGKIDEPGASHDSKVPR
jgi:hypothetical protein